MTEIYHKKPFVAASIDQECKTNIINNKEKINVSINENKHSLKSLTCSSLIDHTHSTQATQTQVCLHRYGLRAGIKADRRRAELDAQCLLLTEVKKALKYIRRFKTEERTEISVCQVTNFKFLKIPSRVLNFSYNNSLKQSDAEHCQIFTNQRLYFLSYTYSCQISEGMSEHPQGSPPSAQDIQLGL